MKSPKNKGDIILYFSSIALSRHRNSTDNIAIYFSYIKHKTVMDRENSDFGHQWPVSTYVKTFLNKI